MNGASKDLIDDFCPLFIDFCSFVSLELFNFAIEMKNMT